MMNKALEKNINTLERLLEISDFISSSSILMSAEEKNLRKEAVSQEKKSLLRYQTDLIDHLSSLSIRGLIEGFLIFWNENLSLDSERFWAEVEKEKIDVKRKRSLRNILIRGRILDVHEAMSARAQWTELMSSTFVAKQFSETEREQLHAIMEADEIKRVNLFKKCIRNQNLPNSSALMYWDSMAYFSMYNLFEKHFNTSEIYQIIKIKKDSDERILKEYNESRYRGGSQILPTT